MSGCVQTTSGLTSTSRIIIRPPAALHWQQKVLPQDSVGGPCLTQGASDMNAGYPPSLAAAASPFVFGDRLGHRPLPLVPGGNRSGYLARFGDAKLLHDRSRRPQQILHERFNRQKCASGSTSARGQHGAR